jgi:hypothetical protein
MMALRITPGDGAPGQTQGKSSYPLHATVQRFSVMVPAATGSQS